MIYSKTLSPLYFPSTYSIKPTRSEKRVDTGGKEEGEGGGCMGD